MIKKRKIENTLKELIIESVKPGNPLRSETFGVLLKMLKLAFWFGYYSAKRELDNNTQQIQEWAIKNRRLP